MFVIQVNGQDVSNSSHEDAVRCFQSAQEPIIVEVLRRQPGQTITPIQNNGTTRNENEKNLEDTVRRTSGTGNAKTTTSIDGIASDELTGLNSTNEDSSWKRNSGTTNSSFPFVSTGVQTDWAGLIDEDELLPVALNTEERTNDSFEDFLAHDMDFEVNLRNF